MDQSQGKDEIFVTNATLSKWGNSIAVRIPSQVVKRLNLEEGAEIEVVITPDQDILLRPMRKTQITNEELREHLKLLLLKIKEGSPRHDEVDLGIEGKELI